MQILKMTMVPERYRYGTAFGAVGYGTDTEPICLKRHWLEIFYFRFLFNEFVTDIWYPQSGIIAFLSFRISGKEFS
jgi:hypothetical protein